MNKYNKQDAVMTRGFAIICMVVLHLFCRAGADVFGTPLIWINSETPLVYWFGFYAEICVSIYSICMGYAQYLLYTSGKTSWKSTGKRILKLMMNYWIILIIFSLIGLLYSQQNSIPGSFVAFLKSIVLLHSYNGAWWFLNSYLLFLLIPSIVKFFPVKKLPVFVGLALCLVVQIGWYFFNKVGFWPTVAEEKHILAFVLKELYNLIIIFPAALAGAFLCKGDIVSKTYAIYHNLIPNKRVRKLVLGIIWVAVFVAMNLIHKAVFTLLFSIISFILFNIWEKSRISVKTWLFFGKHSTNIWLTHMFFYATLFVGLVQKAKYPLLILGFMLVLCIATSYCELFIEKLFGRLFNGHDKPKPSKWTKEYRESS